MNILPKKRWHVRTKENIARVRRDEAEAAEEEKKRVERIKLAEQESRTAFLRQRAREKYSCNSGENEVPQPSADSSDTDTKKEANIYTREGNINFFKDIEAGKKTEAVNKEHEAEKKAEKEKYEKSIGLLTYLGQSTLEHSGPNAWSDELRTIPKKGSVEEEEVGLKSKSAQDPLNDIIKYTGLKPPPKPLVKKSESNPPGNRDTNFTPGFKMETELHETRMDENYKAKHKKAKKERKKKKKHVHKKKRKHKHSKDSERKKRKREDKCSESDEEVEPKTKYSKSNKTEHNKECVSDGSSEDDSDDEREQEEKRKQLEILRAERLKREAEERKRTEKLLKGENPDSKEKEPKPAFKQQYNSQFNPQLARQNQEPKQLQSGVKYWLQ
ncbi:uncharacterized protein LOC143028434 [Oratosquilla oratoria]|uniref:uncharacterized protein LOC143028434 n=1 Tax=Oratosquilla oratoria TaxID=337810 RepID=UPI003F7714C1